MYKTKPISAIISLMSAIILVALSCLLNSCSTPAKSSHQIQVPDFEDGIYLIERTGNKKRELSPLLPNERRIEFNKEFIDKTDQDEKYIVINIEEYAPLKLNTAPITKPQEDKRKILMLNLTEEAKEQLKVFTTKHLKRLTTIVVGGEALTKHQIKNVIDGGYLQITRCTDNACELLYVQLQDNVVKQ